MDDNIQENSLTGSGGSSTATCSVDRLRVLDLFSGIGGFSLGLERAGMKTVAFCEIEEFPRKVLKKHWPDVPLFEDVRKLHASDLPEAVDVICGGYPCQPFSCAGKRNGQEDDRHLWPEMFRLVRECGPTWVIAENVIGHITMGLDQVLFDLESEGYTCSTFIIPACSVGAQHKRDRIWIVANSDKLNGDIPRFCASKIPQLKEAKILGDNISDTNSTGRKTGRYGVPQKRQPENSLSWHPGEHYKRHDWTLTEPPVCGAADGISSRVDRIKGLGNAVVPQIPEIIGRAILAQG